MQETWVQSLGREDPLEKGMATHSSIPAWRSPWTEEPGGSQSMGLQRVGHSLQLTLSHTDTEMASSQLPITRTTAKPMAKPGKDVISTDMVKKGLIHQIIFPIINLNPSHLANCCPALEYSGVTNESNKAFINVFDS